MNEKIFEILEYQKILEMLEKHATSQPGMALCRSLMPETDIEKIQNMQHETSAARERIRHNHEITFSKVTDLSRVFEKLENGSSLTPAELLRICNLLDSVSSAKSYGCREVSEEKRDLLDSRFNQLSPLTKINQEIRRCVRSDTELFDTASTGLEKARRKIRAAEEKIQNQLRAFISGKYRNYLSETFISQRDGAYCLAVKYGCRNKVSGTVHGQSGSGGTVFIEPKSVAAASSELQDHKYQEQIEIAIVLGDLSDMVKAQLKYVKKDYTILTQLDFIFAKAYLSEYYNGTAPILNKKKIISIKEGRHPLLDPEKVVPTTMELGRDYDLLVITGPNTGGKTLTMKTIGIMTLMGQAGLHIPAAAGSELSVFKEVFADIGDEQSIAQSLSTFSAHMTNIIKILGAADQDSLILIDELGSGTDPAEGAALAVAILSKLHNKQIRTLATTHYVQIKNYALTTERVQNACCEFDVETLSPTYRLMIGAVGESNAFAISKRLGLEDDIIADAKEYLQKEQA
ncbi:MutS2 family protein [Lachnospiraceae bacterium M18-1]|nr:MutS2 family protein [Lachnospiraceae bacterium M18-1]